MKTTGFLFVTLTLGLAMSTQACSQSAEPIGARPKMSSVGENGVVLLIPGRRITVAGGVDNPPTVVAEGPAGQNPHSFPGNMDREHVDRVRADGDIPPEGQTTFTLWVRDEGGVFLQIENGYRQPMIHVTHLVYLEGDELFAPPTATCAVNARSGSLEVRKKPVAAVRIMGMFPVNDEDICYDPATDKAYKVGARPAAP